MIYKNKMGLITKLFKERVEKKYKILDIKLFGSYARGDNTKDSDLDIMVKLDKVDRNIEEDLFNIAYDLELEYDCLIDILVIPENVSYSLPLYANIVKEGIAF